MEKHLCQSCGACCAFFKVSFHWTETSRQSHHVPERLTAQVTQYTNSMNGTEKEVCRCTALVGVVGESASCSIYENRPSPCRNFKASFEDGTRSDGCDTARLAKGLSVLTPLSWAPKQF
jgi:Fe-S-cluster containining protein